MSFIFTKTTTCIFTKIHAQIMAPSFESQIPTLESGQSVSKNLLRPETLPLFLFLQLFFPRREKTMTWGTWSYKLWCWGELRHWFEGAAYPFVVWTDLKHILPTLSPQAIFLPAFVGTVLGSGTHSNGQFSFTLSHYLLRQPFYKTLSSPVPLRWIIPLFFIRLAWLLRQLLTHLCFRVPCSQTQHFHSVLSICPSLDQPALCCDALNFTFKFK